MSNMVPGKAYENCDDLLSFTFKSSRSSSSSSFEDNSSVETDEEQEKSNEYNEGGYCYIPTNITLKNNYLVIRKLGWGFFSTVWLCKNLTNLMYVAIKVIKCKTRYRQNTKYEIEYLNDINAGKLSHEGHNHVVKMIDNFTFPGPYGLHVAIVFEVCGKSLLSIIKHYNYHGIPLSIVKRMMKHLLLGLSYLHNECEIIHTDIKPENIILSIDLKSIERMEREVKNVDPYNVPSKYGCNCKSDVIHNFQKWCQTHKNVYNDTKNNQNIHMNNIVKDITNLNFNQLHPITYLSNFDETYSYEDILQHQIYKIADLGNATNNHEHYDEGIQTREYRCPETIIGSTWNETSDIWASACTGFELVTGDYLFDPIKGRNFDEDDDHLGLMQELLGPIPYSIFRDGSNYRKLFNARGKLKRIADDVPQWPLFNVLVERYKWSTKNAQLFSDFLLPMLSYSFLNRPTADQLLPHPWLRENV